MSKRESCHKHVEACRPLLYHAYELYTLDWVRSCYCFQSIDHAEVVTSSIRLSSSNFVRNWDTLVLKSSKRAWTYKVSKSDIKVLRSIPSASSAKIAPGLPIKERHRAIATNECH